MRNSIGFQLFTRGLIILLFILSIAIAGRICISLLKKTSNKVFTEYIELEALQNLKNELYATLTKLDKFLLFSDENSKNDFESSLSKVSSQLQYCYATLTHRHDHGQLDLINTNLAELDRLKRTLFSSQLDGNQLDEIHREAIRIVYGSLEAAELLVVETQVEIEEFIQTNNTAVRHSTITILSLGFLLLLIVSIGGILFIRKITSPISKLLTSTNKIRKGKFDTIVNIDTYNEFNALAESFNEMIQTLDKTTISRDYYDSILENMIEPLIVCDHDGKIQTINQFGLKLLGYKKEEILNQAIDKLFYSTENEGQNALFTEIKSRQIISAEKIFLTKTGNKIPVLISSSAINKNGHVYQYIVIAHDLTEKREIENKLEKERNEKQIAINDAHEEEKFRIAIDLHDGLGQILTATSYAFQNYFGEIKKDDKDYQEKVNKIQAQIDSAIHESKNIAHNLIPIALKDFGLVVAITNLIEQANQRSNIKFEFETFNYTSRINEKLEKAIFRIFQEAINNTLRHSKAQNANFQINKYDDSLVISIEDDGIGFELNEKTGKNNLNGIGLIGIRERVRAFNGNLTINSSPGAGTEILIEIPC